MSSTMFLEVRATSWMRETHGLFDYEAKSIKKTYMKLDNSTSVYRTAHFCYSWDMTNMDDFKEGSEPLLNIKKYKDYFQISQISNSSNDKMWQVVKFMKTWGVKGYALKQGDWIKLGRAKFHIKQIQLANISQADLSLLPKNYDPDSEASELPEEPNTESLPCRICLSETTSHEDPLIIPCKCAGTMKFVHVNCLKEWLKNRIATRESTKAVSYYWKDFSCELCKSKLPLSIQIDNHKYELIGFSHPTKPFIALEDFRPDLRQSNGIHIISLESGESVDIGRGHECDVKLSDISVSRHHSKIKLINNQFYIEDQNSKFGTLLQIKEVFNLEKGQDIAIQVNRTLFQLDVKEPISCFSCFNKCRKNRVCPRVDEMSHLTRDGDNGDELCADRAKRFPRTMVQAYEGSFRLDEEINSSNVLGTPRFRLSNYEEAKDRSEQRSFDVL